METLEEKVKRVLADEIHVVAYDTRWPAMFEQERDHLLACMPAGLVLNIEHFGSTAVPGLVAKPVIDMAIEVRNVDEAKVVVPEILEPQSYDCFWRPTSGNDTPPWFTWCIKRGDAGRRTHHLHIGEVGFRAAEMTFRNILRSRPDVAAAYAQLKLKLVREHAADRVAYTEAKTEFISAALKRK